MGERAEAKVIAGSPELTTTPKQTATVSQMIWSATREMAAWKGGLTQTGSLQKPSYLISWTQSEPAGTLSAGRDNARTASCWYIALGRTLHAYQFWRRDASTSVKLSQRFSPRASNRNCGRMLESDRNCTFRIFPVYMYVLSHTSPRTHCGLSDFGPMDSRNKSLACQGIARSLRAGSVSNRR
jgi:hypothetical protein